LYISKLSSAQSLTNRLRTHPPSPRRTITFVEAPVQPGRIECGSICSLKVNETESPASATPDEPPARFAVWMSEADGAVLSTVVVKFCWPL
jgi:hypothetical protein